jgi:hypothetical protein
MMLKARGPTHKKYRQTRVACVYSLEARARRASLATAFGRRRRDRVASQLDLGIVPTNYS